MCFCLFARLSQQADEKPAVLCVIAAEVRLQELRLSSPCVHSPSTLIRQSGCCTDESQLLCLSAEHLKTQVPRKAQACAQPTAGQSAEGRKSEGSQGGLCVALIHGEDETLHSGSGLICAEDSALKA